MEIKHVISANVAVLGSVSETRVSLAKWCAAQTFGSYGEKVTEVKRLLSFGNVGRKLLTEDIARRVEIHYSLAQIIVKEIESAI
ncbi:hypothetical protein F9047_10275 [Escherichia coli]|uniref:Uncharacterized protein n=1 Tax=Cronobacter phage PBES 02 TaxID=1684115 RepID=A0A0K1YAQ7_9CAUD|nr:hypothetical protein ADU18_0278 [Cronobacter phage PBES 02]AKY04171.1 hypothetical protein ADU18_0278 [Cronobacter phage PBES 02]KAB3178333.1 hypothetical protein F9047_10275 [Escherichia coli]QEG12237.1 hypothetical protein OMEGA_171 [Klebsiella phage vB_KaeM_KaOmega]UTC25363.1 hypothetical protein P7_173 [Pectobacterium phage vB_PcaM_P7_Pc]